MQTNKQDERNDLHLKLIFYVDMYVLFCDVLLQGKYLLQSFRGQ